MLLLWTKKKTFKTYNIFKSLKATENSISYKHFLCEKSDESLKKIVKIYSCLYYESI